jgi:hypothetical protein
MGCLNERVNKRRKFKKKILLNKEYVDDKDEKLFNYDYERS